MAVLAAIWGFDGIPAGYVSRGLHPAPGILLRGSGADERGGSASNRPVHNLADVTSQKVSSVVHGIVGRVPACIGKRVIKRPLVGQPKATAQGGPAISEDIPGKADSWPKIIVVARSQCGGGCETSRTTRPSQRRTRIPGTRRAGILDLAGAGGDVVDQVLPRPLQEGRGQMVQFGVAGEEIVAQAKIQRQLPADLPIVLNVCADLPVSPVPDAGFQMGRCVSCKSWIDSGKFEVGCISREEQRVEEVVRRSPHIKVAILYVPPHVHACLQVVLAMVDRDHIGVGVNVLVKCLRIAIVRSEPQSSIVKTNRWHTGEIHADIVSIPGVPRPELIQYSWAEGMDVTELEIGRCHSRRIQEAAKAVTAASVLIRLTSPS